jgi:type VI secretion system secreted protein VgrG
MAKLSEKTLCTLRSPLGDDVFAVERLRGEEAISRPYHFLLELTSQEPGLDFEKVVGLPMALELPLADGGVRVIQGLVSRFTQSEAREQRTIYRAELVPWLWLLTRNRNCRIFQHKSVPEIVTQIFEEHGYRDHELRLGSYEPREYCVQYRESDFAFVSRLLEEEGIAYYFKHEPDRHVLVLFDSPAGNDVCPDRSSARFDAAEGNDAIHHFELSRELRAGSWTLCDFDFENPDLDLISSAPSAHALGGSGRFEIYDFPGAYRAIAEGDRRSKRRIEAEECASWTIRGQSECRELSAGFHFDLCDHYREDCNGGYLVTRVEHDLAARGNGKGPAYSNRFQCIPASVCYRDLPRTPRPLISGVQTATVVGAAGKEIDVDRHGRVIVQFHWDREGQRDQNSSCRVRVAQNWAGNRWGAMFHPRVGQEVIVDFLEGDPDRPIVVGRVYNGKQLPPYDLPANATQSGLKTRSARGGGQRNFNELRFEDRLGSEEIYLHAEKDQNVVIRNDLNEDVGHDETLEVKNDRKRRVGKDETLRVGANQELVVGQDQVVRIGNNGSIDAENQLRIVVGKSSLTLKRDGTIILDGVEVYVNGVELSLRGRKSLKYHSDSILGLAYTEHQIRGARLKHNP